jgi:hypothetical protein
MGILVWVANGMIVSCVMVLCCRVRMLYVWRMLRVYEEKVPQSMRSDEWRLAEWAQ